MWATGAHFGTFYVLWGREMGQNRTERGSKKVLFYVN